MRKLLCLLLILPLLIFAMPEVSAEESNQDFIVVLNNLDVSELEAQILHLGYEINHYFEEISVAVVSGPQSRLARLKAIRGVVQAGPQSIFAAPQTIAMEPLTVEDSEGLTGPGDLWGIYGWDIKRVTDNGATYAKQMGSKDVVVGIIDSGLWFSHPDLKDNIVPGSQTFVPGTEDAWDEDGHGTHVAGTIAANGRFIGVAPNTGIRAYRVFGAEGGAASSWIIAALIAAANDGVDVINMSLGGYRLLTNPDHVADTVAYQRALRYAVNSGAVIVVSAGNDAFHVTNPNRLAREFGIKNGAVINVPGGLPGTITVSATNIFDELTAYSNFGQSFIDITAPGGSIEVGVDPTLSLSLSTYLDDWYIFMAGTSMAAPKVSGIAALIRAEYGDIPPMQVINMIKKNAEKLDGQGYSPYFGWGMATAASILP